MRGGEGKPARYSHGVCRAGPTGICNCPLTLPGRRLRKKNGDVKCQEKVAKKFQTPIYALSIIVNFALLFVKLKFNFTSSHGINLCVSSSGWSNWSIYIFMAEKKLPVFSKGENYSFLPRKLVPISLGVMYEKIFGEKIFPKIIHWEIMPSDNSFRSSWGRARECEASLLLLISFKSLLRPLFD